MFIFSKTRSVSPEWFRRNVLPAYENTWDECEAFLFADPFEAQRIEELTEEIVSVGLQEPVVVERREWYHRKPRLCDGTHRTVALMKLGQDIDVHYGYPYRRLHPTEPYSADVYEISPIEGYDVDMGDAAMSLSSFRCSAGTWVQTDVCSGTVNGPVEIVYPTHAPLRELIAEELQQRFANHGLRVHVKFVEVLR